MTVMQEEPRKESARVRQEPAIKKLGSYLKEFFRPRYHIQKFIEDIRSAKYALKNREVLDVCQCEESMARAIRGRLFACYVLTSIGSGIGILIGQTSQYVSGNRTVSYLLGVFLSNLLATLTFQVAWFVSHRPLYVRKSKSIFKQIWFMWKDIAPIQLQGFLRVLVTTTLVILTVLGIIALLERFAPGIAQVIPFVLLGTTLEQFIQNIALVRLLGDIFEHHSHLIAKRHVLVK